MLDINQITKAIDETEAGLTLMDSGVQEAVQEFHQTMGRLFPNTPDKEKLRMVVNQHADASGSFLVLSVSMPAHAIGAKEPRYTQIAVAKVAGHSSLEFKSLYENSIYSPKSKEVTLKVIERELSNAFSELNKVLVMYRARLKSLNATKVSFIH